MNSSTLFVQVSPYKVGFDKWNVEIVDDTESSLPPQKRRVDLIQNKENSNTYSANTANDDSNIRFINSNEIETNLSIASNPNSDNIGSNSTTNKDNHSFPSDASKISSVLTSNKSSLLLNGKYFEIVEQNEKLILAKCMTCRNVYKGITHTTSNFTTHLKVSTINRCPSFYIVVLFEIF